MSVTTGLCDFCDEVHEGDNSPRMCSARLRAALERIQRCDQPESCGACIRCLKHEVMCNRAGYEGETAGEKGQPRDTNPYVGCIDECPNECLRACWESGWALCVGEGAEVEALRDREQRAVDAVCHYRNLAIRLGAAVRDMRNDHDRRLCETGVPDDACENTGDIWDDNERLLIEVEALRDALTIWCQECWMLRDTPRSPDARPAVVRLEWSDRVAIVCAEHVPCAICDIVLDHSYDRCGIGPVIEPIAQHSLLRLDAPPSDIRETVERICAAARGYLDEFASGWHSRTIDLTDEQCDELMAQLRAAAERPPCDAGGTEGGD